MAKLSLFGDKQSFFVNKGQFLTLLCPLLCHYHQHKPQQQQLSLSMSEKADDPPVSLPLPHLQDTKPLNQNAQQQKECNFQLQVSSQIQNGPDAVDDDNQFADGGGLEHHEDGQMQSLQKEELPAEGTEKDQLQGVQQKQQVSAQADQKDLQSVFNQNGNEGQKSFEEDPPENASKNVISQHQQKESHLSKAQKSLHHLQAEKGSHTSRTKNEAPPALLMEQNLHMQQAEMMQNQFQVSRSHMRQEKPSEDEIPFKWGTEDNTIFIDQPDFEEFFLNQKLQASEEILKGRNADLFDEPIYTRNPKSEPVKRKQPIQEVDIWKDLRQSMVKKAQFQAAESQLRQKRGKGKPLISLNKRRSQSEKKLSIKSRADKIIPIAESKQQNETKQGAALQNIYDMKQQIAEKIKSWSKQQKQLERKRKKFIEKQQLSIQMQEKEHKVSQSATKDKDRQQRVKRVLERLQRRRAMKQKQTKSVSNKDLLQKESPNPKNVPTIIKKGKEKQKQKEKEKQKGKQKGKEKGKEQEKNKGNEKEKIIKAYSSEVLPNHRPKEDELPSVINLHKDMEQHEKERIKLSRRRKFNEKLHKIPINISMEKRMKMLIGIDKSMNPLKYQIMGRKGLNDEQIYLQTREFEVPNNSRNLGKQYLQELRVNQKSENIILSLNSIYDESKKKSKKGSGVMELSSHSRVAARDYHPNPEIQRIASSLALYDNDEYLSALRKQ